MDKIRVKKLIDYWLTTSEHDYQTMLFLFKSRRYPDSLFYGHIVLEKILKALVVQDIQDEAPKIHDLVELSKKACLDLSKDELAYLKIVNRFNMRTRYPDVKLNFYKLCDLKYTNPHLNKIKNFYQKLRRYVKK